MTRIRIMILLMLCFNSVLSAQDALENYSANLPATDGQGRKLPITGQVNKERFVGLFYWTWHYQYQATKNKPIDLSKLLQEVPSLAMNSNYDDSLWPKDKVYFWGEPLFGFYTSTDEWVLWKHAEMLADASIDVIIFDCTNGDQTWKLAYTALCDVFTRARRNGICTPKIAFMTALGPVSDGQNAINHLYNDLYRPGLYKDLWFYWKGKPLLLGYPDLMIDIPGNPEGSQLHKEMRNFFTFRPIQPDYQNDPERPDQWGWLQIFPQHSFVKVTDNKFEEIPVSVSQNWAKGRGLTAMNAPGVFGRSYTNKQGYSKSRNAYLNGLNFQEQWNRALRQNVEFVFITGWNEWIVDRQREWRKQPNAFPDEYNSEYSRDIEPMKNGHNDNFYYQMVANIRRFKGVPPEQRPSVRKTILIDGLFEEWGTVLPQYKAHKGSTIHRNSPGFQSYQYVNNSGRNDIIGAKIARDNKFVYFYVQTVDKISPSTDSNWMTLFIDADRNKKTGWQGYELAINRKGAGKTASLEKTTDGSEWTKLQNIQYAYRDNSLEIRVPRSLLQTSRNLLDFEFKWSDNRQSDTDIMDFWVNGDVAPSGRYNYHYKAD